MKNVLFELINVIKNKSFNKAFRGYDPVQVNAFLKRTAYEIEEALGDYQDLNRKYKKLEVDLQEYKEREDLFKKTLSKATEISNKMQEDSSREAKLIISDAEHRAEMITREAKDSLRKIYQDISDLRRVRLQFENNLKAILQSHLTMLEQGQRTVPDPVVDEGKIKKDLEKLKPKTMNFSEDKSDKEFEAEY